MAKKDTGKKGRGNTSPQRLPDAVASGERAERDRRFLLELEEILRGRRRHLAIRVAERLASSGVFGPVISEAAEPPAKEWIAIESLSRLRGVVGGRFQNIKDRWIAAGFPLREHRGDREGSVEMSQDGWLELVSWMAKQGYDARLAPPGSGAIFEVRAAPTRDK